MRTPMLILLAGIAFAATLLAARRAASEPRRLPAPAGGAPHPVRPAGPAAMRDPPPRWDEIDEASDQSFPASDAPARY